VVLRVRRAGEQEEGVNCCRLCLTRKTSDDMVFPIITYKAEKIKNMLSTAGKTKLIVPVNSIKQRGHQKATIQ
jgi:hypothetical protein